MNNRRTIKFRMWSTSAKKFFRDDRNIYGCLLNSKLQPALYEDMVWMQWTGLVDRHGKEIYEGDILHFENQEGVWPDQVNKNIEVKHPFICGNAHLGEIIGNIFES